MSNPDTQFERGAGRPPKVAIACPGVGLVQRGYERYFLDIFNSVKEDIDITLYKGGGERSETERVLTFVPRNGSLVKIFPVHKLFHRTHYHSECGSFALALLYQLMKEDYDIVHCIDPPLTRLLVWLRGFFRMKFKILYTHGCDMDPYDFPGADHTQHVSKARYLEAAECGIPEEHMSLVPVGFHPEHFEVDATRDELRRSYGVNQDTFVIICIAAIDRIQKRLDYLIEEVSRLDGDYLLWLDGSLDHSEPALIDLAKDTLGDKCRVTRVDSDKVGELHHLTDVMVLCSLDESFGLAMVEGAGSGTPVLSHNSAHFQWLLPNPESWVDMSRKGALTERLATLMSRRDDLEGLKCLEEIRSRFDWKNLKQDYVDLYYHVAGLPDPRTRATG